MTEEKKSRTDDVRELAELMLEYDLTEISVEEEGETRRIRLRRGGKFTSVSAMPMTSPTPALPAQPMQVTETPDASNMEIITAPMVGTFYASARPGEPSFVNIGDHVQPGAVFCILEAMKLMNQLEAEFACEIVEILVKNATPVEYGQALFRVRRT